MQYVTGVTQSTYAAQQFVVDNLATRYANITAGTSIIKLGSGQLYKAVVNSHTSGTIKIWDSISTSAPVTPIFNTITLAAGERNLDFGGVVFGTGCVAVVGGTADITLSYI